MSNLFIIFLLCYNIDGDNMKKIIMVVMMFTLVGCNSYIDKDTYINEMNQKAAELDNYRNKLYSKDSQEVIQSIDDSKDKIMEMVHLNGPKELKDQEDVLDEALIQLYDTFNEVSISYQNKDVETLNNNLEQLSKKALLVGSLSTNYDPSLFIKP